MQNIAIRKKHVLSSLITVKFNELGNFRELKKKSFWHLAGDVLEHGGSMSPGLTAALKLSVSLDETTKHGSYSTFIIY